MRLSAINLGSHEYSNDLQLCCSTHNKDRYTAFCDAFLSLHCLKISAIYATVTHLLAYTKQESPPASFFRINKYWLPNLLLAAGVFLPFELLPIGNITGREQPPNLCSSHNNRSHSNLSNFRLHQICHIDEDYHVKQLKLFSEYHFHRTIHLKNV